MSIKVMLADDHVLCRQGIKELLIFDGSIEVIGEASNGEECLRQLEKIMPDILILDINMPILNGIDVLKEIRKKHYPVKVLILTYHNEIDYLLKVFDLGIEGYLVKNIDVNELKKAVSYISNDKTYIQPDLVPLLNSKLRNRDNDTSKLEILTSREKEMLVYLAKGMLNKEIAIELKISERTVKNHISNLFKKIDVYDRTQAAVFAIKNGLVDVY